MSNPVARQGSETNWVTIFMGEPWRVALLEGELESAGILTLVPDRVIKTIDPFITGANALDLRLQVPAFQQTAALDLLAQAELERPAPEALTPDEAWLVRKNAEGRRLRFAALFPFTIPLVPWLAWRYFSGWRGGARKPAGHGFTVFALGYSLLAFVAIAVLAGDWLSLVTLED